MFEFKLDKDSLSLGYIRDYSVEEIESIEPLILLDYLHEKVKQNQHKYYYDLDIEREKITDEEIYELYEDRFKEFEIELRLELCGD